MGESRKSKREGWRYALLLACALTLVAAVACLVGCGAKASGHVDGLTLDPAKVTWSNGRPSYDDAGCRSQIGIDVSENQGDVNWKQVANDGIDFAFVRVGYRGSTEGMLYPDDCYTFNLAAAQQVGLTVGAYFFSQAVTPDEARQEANLAIQLLRARGFSGQVAFDYEIADGGRIGGVSPQTASACARAFCETVEKAGFEAVLYGNAEDLRYYDDDLKSAYPVWFASFSQEMPREATSAAYWQYTHKGTVAGIDGLVDMNLRVEKK